MIELILLRTFLGFSIVFFMMTVLWVIYRRTNKPMIVDAGWGTGLALLGILYSVMGEGDEIRRIILAVMIAIWGFRLSAHLFVNRIIGTHHDARYDMLEDGWKTNIGLKYFLFYQFQAVLIALMMSPVIIIAENSDPSLALFEYAGIILWCIALFGESLSDAQLQKFKNDPKNAGKVCTVGLWNYSRHPNYFFEWLVWISFVVFSLNTPYGWVTIIPAMIMLYLLFRVTGIPLTEERSLKSKGDAYREYQRTTSAFFPWFKKT